MLWPLRTGVTQTVCTHGAYRVVRFYDPTDQLLPRMTIYLNEDVIREYTPRRLDQYTSLGEDGPRPSVVIDLPCWGFANRAGKPQPKAFDSIIGNGPPTLLIDERDATYNNRDGITNFLTVVSISGRQVDETPAVPASRCHSRQAA
jgi:hypothetical protein